MRTLPIPTDLLSVDQIVARVRTTPSGCWDWCGLSDRDGYGRYATTGRSYRAHRVVYTVLVGPIPPGAPLDHLCLNRLCVNPEHVEVVTVQVNTARGRGITAPGARARLSGCCVKGHVIADVGTHRNGHRGRGHGAALLSTTCAQCGRDRVARYKARRLNLLPTLITR